MKKIIITLGIVVVLGAAAFAAVFFSNQFSPAGKFTAALTSTLQKLQKEYPLDINFINDANLSLTVGGVEFLTSHAVLIPDGKNNLSFGISCPELFEGYYDFNYINPIQEEYSGILANMEVVNVNKTQYNLDGNLEVATEYAINSQDSQYTYQITAVQVGDYIYKLSADIFDLNGDNQGKVYIYSNISRLISGIEFGYSLGNGSITAHAECGKLSQETGRGTIKLDGSMGDYKWSITGDIGTTATSDIEITPGIPEIDDAKLLKLALKIIPI